MRRVLTRVLISVVIALAVLYALDYLVLRYRVASNRNPYGTVTVRPYYAVPRKDHKIEYMFDDPHDQACVNSLFPHFGDLPCWYLTRHKEPRIDM